MKNNPILRKKRLMFLASFLLPGLLCAMLYKSGLLQPPVRLAILVLAGGLLLAAGIVAYLLVMGTGRYLVYIASDLNNKPLLLELPSLPVQSGSKFRIYRYWILPIYGKEALTRAGKRYLISGGTSVKATPYGELPRYYMYLLN